MTAPKFDALLHSEARQKSQSIALVFKSVDKKRFAIELALACAPITVAAIAAELGRIVPTRPADKTPQMQGIQCVGTQLAMKDDGTVSLLLRLQSGAELPLEFQQADLARLRDQIGEAAELADRSSHH